MVHSPENRSRNGHVLVWDQPGLQNDPNSVQKPESKYLSTTLLVHSMYIFY